MAINIIIGKVVTIINKGKITKYYEKVKNKVKYRLSVQ